MVDLNQYKPQEDTPFMPLRRFSGVLSDISEEDMQGQRGIYKRIKFGFTELKVIEATDPYPFPIAVISMGLGKSSSRWGVWWKSAIEVLGNEDINSLQGKRQEWAMLPATLRQPLTDAEGHPVPDLKDPNKQAWGDVEVPCWQIVSVDGFGSTEDVLEQVLDMLDGKTDAQFHHTFQSSELARNNVSLMTENVNRQLLPRLQSEGKAMRNADGVWHKVTTSV